MLQIPFLFHSSLQPCKVGSINFTEETYSIEMRLGEVKELTQSHIRSSRGRIGT